MGNAWNSLKSAGPLAPRQCYWRLDPGTNTVEREYLGAVHRRMIFLFDDPARASQLKEWIDAEWKLQANARAANTSDKWTRAAFIEARSAVHYQELGGRKFVGCTFV